jgi:endonuclease-3
MTEDDTDDGEPNHNIGAAAGERRSFPAGGPDDTRAEYVVDRLGEVYWQRAYGGRPALDCLVRTILSQNTTDAASAPAHEALRERYADHADLDAAALAAADTAALAETVAGAGLQHQKARRIVAAAERVLAEYDSAAAFDAFVSERDPETVRERLLSFDGVGPKTADCVLLFAGGRDGVFPVDTHVHRLYRRLGVAPPDADPEAVRETLEDAVPPEKCGFGHTASIEFGREYCSTRRPACLDDPEACPLVDHCDRVGVDTETGSVVDPADTVGD